MILPEAPPSPGTRAGLYCRFEPSRATPFDRWYNLVYTSGMKTAISLPDSLFDAAQRLAARLGVSRSELFQRALKAFLHQHGQDGVTEALNQVYGADDPSERLDPVLDQMQRASLPGEKW